MHNKDLIAGTQSDEIGPNFDRAHFFKTLNRAALTAWQTRCKKISGHEYQYAIAMYAREEFMPCIENWERAEKFYDDQNVKSTLKQCVFYYIISILYIFSFELKNLLKIYFKSMHKTQRIFRMHR